MSSIKFYVELEIGRSKNIYIRLCIFGKNKNYTSDHTYTVTADVNLAEK